MKNFKRHMATAILYIFSVVTVLTNFNTSASAAEKISKVPLEAINGQLIIKLRDTKDKNYENIIKKHNGKVLEYFGSYALASFEKEEVSKVKSELTSDKNVEYSEENAVGRKSTTVIDPLAKTQDYLFYSRAMDAWDLVTDSMKKATVKIAIVDSGVKIDHPELKGSVDPGMNYVSGSTNINDDNGHGTQVAGVIAAKHNNIGINGIAGLINTRIIPVKVLDANGAGSTANIAKGIIYAANSGAQIINVSINGKGYSNVVNDAVQYAIGKGAIVVSSAGDNNDYAENYWPCNSSGIIVASDNYTNGNKGKNVDVYAPGSGNTTDIGKSGYKVVGGSSISAAVTTGTIALMKAKDPSYTTEQIRNVLRKSMMTSGGYGNYLSVKQAIQNQSDFITITSPATSQSTTGDVISKITALNPSQLKQMSLFINNSSNAFTVVKGNGSKSYDVKLPFTELVDGVNKIKVVATDNSGKTYSDERYFNSYGSNNILSITVKDQSGKPAKNKLVKLYKDNSWYDGKEVITDGNGNAIFYNTSKNSIYTVVIRNGDGDSTATPLLFVKKNLSVGKAVIDLSTEAKEITINAFKADNVTKLSDANFYFDYLNADGIKLNKGSPTKVIVNKNLNADLKVLSSTEGYYYVKTIGDYNNINAVNFTKDSSVAKVDISDPCNKQIVSADISLFVQQPYGNFGYLTNFNVKDKSVYISKGDYQYTYRANYGSFETSYRQEDISISGDTVIKYGEPKIQIVGVNGSNSINVGLTDQKHSFVFERDSSSKLILGLKDPNGKALVKGTDFTYDINSYNENSNTINVNMKNPIKGNYQATVSTNYMGKVISSNVINISFVNGTQQSQVSVKYTLPSELKNLILNQKDDTLNVRYYVYNVSTGAFNRIFSSGESFSANGGEFKIPSQYCNSNYRVLIQGSTEKDKGFIYDRQLGSPVKGYINIDPSSSTKKLSFNGKDIDKYIKDSDFSLSKSITKDKIMCLFIKATNKNNLNIWADYGNYSSIISNSEALIKSDFTVSASNSVDNIDTTNLATFKFILPQSNNLKNIRLFKKDNAGYELGDYSVNYSTGFKITPGILIDGFYLGVIDNSFNSRDYRFEGSYSAKALETKTIDLSKCTVTYNNVPATINKSNQLNVGFKVSAGNFTLTQLYGGYSYLTSNNTFDSYSQLLGFDIYSNNKFVTSKYTYSNESNFGSSVNLDLSSLYAGSFNFKLNLQGLNLIDNGFNLKVTGDDMKIKVMNPFDTSKPLINSTVSISGGNSSNTYETGRDGVVYIPKSNLTSDADLIIKANTDNGLAIYKSKIDISKSEVTVNTAIAALKNIKVRPLDAANGVSIANAVGELNVKDSWTVLSIDNLDLKGQKQIYSNINFSAIKVKTDTSFLTTNYSGNGDIVVDNKNVAKLDVLLVNGYSNMDLTKNLYGYYTTTNTIYKSGTYNISSGKYDYTYYLNGYKYLGSISANNNSTIKLRFGNNLSLNADYSDSYGTTPTNIAKPGENIYTKLYFKDEYGNNITSSNYGSFEYKYIVTINGREVKTGTCSSYDVSTVSINPGVVASSFDIKFEITRNSKKYTSNTLNYKMNLDNYKQISVKDPQGNPIIKGKFANSSYELSNCSITNGIAYIEKSSLKNGLSNVSLSGVSSNGNSVIYTGLTLNSNTTEIKDATSKKVAITSNLPASNNLSAIWVSIYNNNNNQYSQSLFNDNYNLSDFNAIYKNNYIWLPKGNYLFNANFSLNNSNNNESYMLADTTDGTKAINLNYTNTTSVSVKGTSNCSLGLLVGDTTIYSSIGANNIGKISSNMFNGYYVNDYSDSKNQLVYKKKLSSKITGASYVINVGKQYKAKAEIVGDSQLTPVKEAKANVYLLDQYDNSVSSSNGNGSKDITINLSNNGKLIDTIKQSVYANEQSYQVSFKPNVITSVFDATFSLSFIDKSYTSNSLNYKMNLDNYKQISVKDPEGNPIVKGKFGNSSYELSNCTITNGVAYIEKSSLNNGLNNVSLSGVSSNGSSVIYTGLTLNSNTTEIKDATLKKVAITANLPANNNLNSINLSIYSNNNNQYSQNLFSDYYILSDFNTRYKNNYIWLPKGNYFVEASFDSYNNGVDERYVLADTADGSKAINLNYVNTTSVSVKGTSSYSLEVLRGDIRFSCGGTNAVTKITPNMFDGYYLNDYSDSKNKLIYKKKLSSKITGASYVINVGKQYKAKAEIVGDSQLTPVKEAKANVYLLDQYDNSVSSSNDYGSKDITINFSNNGKLIDTVKQSVYASEQSYQVSFKPNVITSVFDATFSLSFIDKSYTSNSLNYKMNLDNYKQISVKDPEGNPIVKGKFGNSSYQLSNCTITNGVAYIEKSLLKNGVSNVSLSGISSKGASVIYTGLTLNSNTTEIKDATLKKVAITANLPVSNNLNSIGFFIYNNDNNQYSQNLFSDYYNLSDFNARYKNNYVWLPKGNYLIEASFGSYNNGVDERYVLADTADGSKTINLNYTNTTSVSVKGTSNYSLDVLRGDIRISCGGTNTVTKVSPNIFDGYYINDYSDSKNQLVYKKKLSSKIAGTSYVINVGKQYKLKAQISGDSKLTPDKEGKANVSILDEYDNSVSSSNDYGSKDITINLSNNGKVIDTIKQNVYFYNQPYEINFKPNVITSAFDATFSLKFIDKIYTSNSINYTLDVSNYNIIKVQDPSGQPLYKGEVMEYGSSKYKIVQGNLYVPKNDTFNSKFSIVGTNQSGDYVICPSVNISSSDTAMNLQGKKVTITSDLSSINGLSNGRLTINSLDKYNNFNNVINKQYDGGSVSLTNLNIWLQDGVDCYLDNTFTDKSNSQYLIGKKFNNSMPSVNLSANNLTELKLSGSSNKNCSVYLVQNYRFGSSSLNPVNNKVFISPNTYHIDNIYNYSNDSSYIGEYKINDGDCISGSVYTILLGKNYTGNFSIPKVLVPGNNIYISGNINDEYGNTINLYPNAYELNISNSDGKVIKTIKSQSASIAIPSDIADGVYSVNITGYINSNKIASNVIKNVYVNSGNLSNFWYDGRSLNYNLYDGSTLVYSDHGNSYKVLLPNNILSKDKKYNSDVLVGNYDGISHRQEVYSFNNDQLSYSTEKKNISISLESNVKKVILTTAKGTSMTFDSMNNIDASSYSGLINLVLLDGETYTISAYSEDEQGGFWATKIVKADTNLKTIKFDRTNSKKITLKSSKSVEVIGLTAKNTSTGEIFNINRSLKTNGSVYLPSGKYELTYNLYNDGTSALSSCNQVIDMTSNDYNLIVG